MNVSWFIILSSRATMSSSMRICTSASISNPLPSVRVFSSDLLDLSVALRLEAQEGVLQALLIQRPILQPAPKCLNHVSDL